MSRALWRLEDLPPARMLASPQAWAYRNRLRLQVQAGRLGFFARGGRELVEVTACPVAAPAANRILPALAAALAQPELAPLSWVEVLADEHQAFLTLGWPEDGQPLFLEDLAAQVGAAGARLCRGEELADWPLTPQAGLIYHQQPGLERRAYPGIFCQVNWSANQLLLAEVLAAAEGLAPSPTNEVSETNEALDIYAGSGNFSLPLAAAGWRVLCVEGEEESCRAAVVQALQAGLGERCLVQAFEAVQVLAGLVRAERGFDLVVLDPPRAGAKELMPGLLELAPRRVVYVSCHSAALARDAALLTAAGYRAASLAVLDLFPHTGHVEAVLVLDGPQ